MFCNLIHNELRNIRESSCPYCNELLEKGDNTTVSCCNNPNIENDNSMNICTNCGLIQSCVYDSGYIDFYNNIHRMRQKSVYCRKYHIENTLNDLCIQNNVVLTHKQRDQIYEVFNKIGTILPLVNESRKRMISTKFIIRMLFKMMDIPYEIPISKSKRTLAFYDNYWSNIMSHIGDKIKSIIG